MTRHILLTTKDVGIKAGVSAKQVAAWCRAGLIMPVQRLPRCWLIMRNYLLVPRVPGRPPKGKTKKGEPRKVRGRPPGAKNKKPYPVGVKRPRKVPSG